MTAPLPAQAIPEIEAATQRGESLSAISVRLQINRNTVCEYRKRLGVKGTDSAKLSDAAVEDLKASIQSGETVSSIAKRLGVTTTTLWRARRSMGLKIVSSTVSPEAEARILAAHGTGSAAQVGKALGHDPGTVTRYWRKAGLTTLWSVTQMTQRDERILAALRAGTKPKDIAAAEKCALQTVQVILRRMKAAGVAVRAPEITPVTRLSGVLRNFDGISLPWVSCIAEEYRT